MINRIFTPKKPSPPVEKKPVATVLVAEWARDGGAIGVFTTKALAEMHVAKKLLTGFLSSFEEDLGNDTVGQLRLLFQREQYEKFVTEWNYAFQDRYEEDGWPTAEDDMRVEINSHEVQDR
jgi:hypothetical protein